MPYSIDGRVSVGAYDQPFSNVGIEYFPLGVNPDRTGITLREASSLLLNTDKGIEEITADTGFSDRAYFSRVFKKVTGKSPAQFRRRHAAPRDP